MMPEDASMTSRAQELVELYRSRSRDLQLEEAARASNVIGQMLVEVERAERLRSDVAVRLAEEALRAATLLLHHLHPND
jgi:hypothetical protein